MTKKTDQGLPQIAALLASKGRGGDTMLAHINPQEAALLKAAGGSGTTNPETGLPEFWGIGIPGVIGIGSDYGGISLGGYSTGNLFSDVRKITGASADVVGDVAQKLGNTVESIASDPKKLAAVAVMVAFPGAATTVGETLLPAEAAAALGTTGTAIVGQTAINTALNGGDVSSAVKAALVQQGFPAAAKYINTDTTFGQNLNELLGKYGAQAATSAGLAAIIGQDPVAAFMFSGVQDAVKLLPNEMGVAGAYFKQLPESMQRAVSSAVAAGLLGKDPNQAVASSLINSAVYAAANLGRTQKKLIDSGNKPLTQEQLEQVPLDKAAQWPVTDKLTQLAQVAQKNNIDLTPDMLDTALQKMDATKNYYGSIIPDEQPFQEYITSLRPKEEVQQEVAQRISNIMTRETGQQFPISDALAIAKANPQFTPYYDFGAHTGDVYDTAIQWRINQSLLASAPSDLSESAKGRYVDLLGTGMTGDQAYAVAKAFDNISQTTTADTGTQTAGPATSTAGSVTDQIIKSLGVDPSTVSANAYNRLMGNVSKYLEQGGDPNDTEAMNAFLSQFAPAAGEGETTQIGGETPAEPTPVEPTPVQPEVVPPPVEQPEINPDQGIFDFGEEPAPEPTPQPPQVTPEQPVVTPEQPVVTPEQPPVTSEPTTPETPAPVEPEPVIPEPVTPTQPEPVIPEQPTPEPTEPTPEPTTPPEQPATPNPYENAPGWNPNGDGTYTFTADDGSTLTVDSEGRVIGSTEAPQIEPPTTETPSGPTGGTSGGTGTTVTPPTKPPVTPPPVVPPSGGTSSTAINFNPAAAGIIAGLLASQQQSQQQAPAPEQTSPWTWNWNPQAVQAPVDGVAMGQAFFNPTLTKAAEGGLMSLAGGGTSSSLGSYSDGGRLLRGPGDGMSDNIPAVIGNKQPARLGDGEFVVPADVVSHLGNGSTDAGARVLYDMMDRVRKARTGHAKQGKQINPKKFMPK